MSESNQDGLADHGNIGDFYYLVFRHKWKIIVFALLGVAACGVLFVLTPAVYESEATLLVRYISDTTVLDPTSAGERITAPGRGGENVINSEIAILSSRDLIEKVMDEIGPGRFVPGTTNALDRALLVETIVAAIKIDVPKNSNVIRVTYDGPSPAIAQEFLRRLTESYLLKHIEIHRASGAYEFFSQQTDQLRASLAETEEDLRKLKYSEGIVSIEDTKKNISLRAEGLTRGLDELETTLAATKARADVLKPILTAPEAPQTSAVWMATAVNEGVAALKARLQRLQQREVELLAAYTADSIPVKNLHDQIEETQRQLVDGKPVGTISNVVSNMSTGTPSPRLLEEQANMAGIQAKITVHKELLTRALADAKRIDAVETRIVQLQRSKELQEANYKYFCQSLEHARIDQALNSGRISNISIVQPATFSVETLRPKLLRNVGIALLLSLALGLGLALSSEYFIDRTIRQPADLQAVLNVPLLMSMPKLNLRRLPGTRRGRSLMLAPYERHHATDAPASTGQMMAGDIYDALRDRLLTRLGPLPTGQPYLLGITSCMKGSGVSTVAAGLALALARNGDERIVLMNVSSDSGLPALFGVDPGAGLVEMVPDGEGNTTVAQHQVFQVPSERSVEKVSNATRVHRFADLVERARNLKAGFVIVDMPHVAETSLTLRLGRLVDGMLMVIASEKVNRSVAERARELLTQSGATLIGSVLNKRRLYVPEWLYPSC